MSNLSLLNQINHCTKKMVRLEVLMIQDKNFRPIYERNFERYYKLRKKILMQIQTKYENAIERQPTMDIESSLFNG